MLPEGKLRQGEMTKIVEGLTNCAAFLPLQSPGKAASSGNTRDSVVSSSPRQDQECQGMAGPKPALLQHKSWPVPRVKRVM